MVAKNRFFEVLSLLESYKGKNPYINNLKKQYKNNPASFTLSVIQMNYVTENYNFEPIALNKIIKITTFIGEQFKEKHNLSFVPEKIAVSYILGKTDKIYHVLGKFQKSHDFIQLFIPMNQVFGDILYQDIDLNIDFDIINSRNKLNRFLLEHQKPGVEFLLKRKKCILADDMGLMKTATSIAATIAGDFKKILILCPASLKLNWFRELSYFNDEKDITIVYGNNWDSSKYTILNYDILDNYYELVDGRNKSIKQESLTNSKLFNAGFDLIICDEAHKLKNSSAKRTKIVQDLVKQLKLENIWLLTGTPMANRPMDLFSLLKIIGSSVANDWNFFVNRYCGAKKINKKVLDKLTGEYKTKKITLTNGASNLEELKIKIKDVILRREKNLLHDLPDKIQVPLYFELSDQERKEYDSLWDDYVKEMTEKGKEINISKNLGETVHLRQFIAKKMLPYTIEKINDIIENTESKVVVFCFFTEELFELYRNFNKTAVIHYGGMTDKEKEKSVEEFQNNPKIKLFIGNIISAGEGITLTTGDITMFNSLTYEPYLMEQAESREHRPGQKKTVTIYKMLFYNTISEKILADLINKTDIINQVI